ncbi:MAG: hypothetical protein J0H72_18740, partial [Burkholderiales bacterium]|nr:hypothetical protein [Burkholderiales bacterium]
MVAIVTGSGLGVQAGSGLVLGGLGQLGQAQLGRGRDQAYVNAANGNLVIGAQDQWLVGQGPDAAVYRSYNSLGTGVGPDWRTGDTRRITGLTGTVNTAGSTVKRVDWDGTETLYRYVAARQRYETTDGAGAYDSLVFAAATQTWTWTQGSGRQSEVYDHAQAGRIISGQDTDGNVRSYVYNTKGLLAEVRTQGGEKTLLVYDATDRLSQLKTVAKGADGITDVTTLQVTYTYFAAGDTRLSRARVSVGPGTQVYDTTYTYVGTSSLVETITTTGGGKVSFTYDASNRVKTIVQWDGTASRTTTLTYAAGKTSIVDALGLTTNLYYDAKGQLTRIESPAVGGTTISRHFAYDPDGNVSSVTDGAGNVTTYQYDGQGNVIRQQDAAGNVVVRTYSSTNDLIS